jgi:superfamily II DNA or RNA helicase
MKDNLTDKIFYFNKQKALKETAPYEHQKKIAKILEDMNRMGSFSTIVTVPTGGGKTRIAVDFCLKRLEEGNNKVVWMSDSIDLLGQSIERIYETNINKDISYQLVCGTGMVKEGTKIKQGGGKNAINVSVDGIKNNVDMLFASVATLVDDKKYEELKNWLIEAQKKGKVFLIYDEVHHIGAARTEDLLKKLFGVVDGQCVLTQFGLIGLTATVYRYDSPVDSFNRWFKCGYDKSGKCIKENTPYGQSSNSSSGEYTKNRIEVVTIKELIDEGILVKPDIIRVDDFEAYKPEPNDMSYLANKIKDNYKKWNKTIIFVDTCENAMGLRDLLANDGVPCFAYVSVYDEKFNDKDFEDFCATDGRDSKLMIAVDKVSEGFDVKDIETIYLYSRVESQISIRQKVGRVLRSTNNEKKARVYWQNYFDYKKKTSNEKGDVKCLTYNRDFSESDEEIQRDIGRWKKGYQLPAGMYLEEIPKDIVSEREYFRRYEYLNVLDMFGLEIALEGIGYYELNNSHKAYARLEERKGYETLHSIIVNDYYSLLIKEDNFETFKDYADALNVNEKTLYENIKVTCFYMSNTSDSMKNTDDKAIKKYAKITNKKYIVKDDDIKAFYEWVIQHDLKMPSYKDLNNGVIEDTYNDTNNTDNDTVSTTEFQDVDNTTVSTTEFQDIEFQKYLGKKYKKGKTLLDGINLYSKFLNYKAYINMKQPKQYSDVLVYGENDSVYDEMLSARAIMSVGAVEETREQGTLKGVTGSLALITKNKSGVYKEQPNVLSRTTRDLIDNNLLLAQALITVDNRIYVKATDVDEYTNSIKSVVEGWEIKSTEDKIVREFLMALGYAENDDIIRMQCELFSDKTPKIPKILQYVIYCKVYKQLADMVEYYNENYIPSPECSNEDDLKNQYEKMLAEYGINALGDLTPVEDVITDYRPYLKAVPYYQGIKPEFLCRMLNEMLRLGRKNNCTFIDAFGGSGTISMNIASGLKMKQWYNDLGKLNEAFFKTLKNRKGQTLKDRVNEFIELILSHTGNDDDARKFFEPYMEVKGVKEFFEKGLEKKEKEYQKNYNKKVHNDTNEKKWEEFDERLKHTEEKFKNIFTTGCNQNITVDDIRKIEEYLHQLLLAINLIYDELKDDNNKAEAEKIKDCDLAFIFFMFYLFPNRHFYNDATIDNLVGMIGNYEQYIDNACKLFKSIYVKCKDAVKLTKKHKSKGETVWYYDIPYSETSNVNYSSDWFEEDEFVNALSKCNDDYIVASRYNICEKEKGILTRTKELNKGNEKLSKKEKNIIKFFLRFVPEEKYQSYEKAVKEKSEEDNEKPDRKGKKSNPWNHISPNRAAKYVVFAFSNTEQANGTEYSILQPKGNVKKHMPVSKDSIRRMLLGTQISNIEVEIMITNIELDLEALPVRQVSDEDGIWCMPSFKTRSSYKIEPVTVIMKYEKFIEDMVFFLLSENIYMETTVKDTAAAFREFYKTMRTEHTEEK